MEILETHSDSVTVVQLSGRINSIHAGRLIDSLRGLLDRGDSAVVIDFARTEYMTSGALRSLLLAEKKAAETGTPMLLCALPPLIHEILEISGLLEIFTVVPTPADAMRMLAVGTKVQGLAARA